MNESERNRTESDRKKKIRERYKGVDPSELEVIPAKESIDLLKPTKILKVAAYVRVSTANDEQTSSFELQKNEFTDQINANPMWEFAGIYSDEGVTGTQLAHRKGMLQMIEDAKAGKINLILTKSIARFARNIVDCLSVIDVLKDLDPPVGVKFEADNLYTLDNTGRMILTILASVAEEESHTKSVIMNWSIDSRFSKGIFLTPELLGYDLDEEGNLIINKSEAETVTVMYNLLINGYSLTEISEILTKYGRKTKLGNTKWTSSSIRTVLENERHCGDILARKTYTPNFMNHKSKKNRNNLTQYRQRDHHEAIVSRDVFDAANQILATRKYKRKNRPLPILSVINNGLLKGFVPIDKDWTGFSAQEYIDASMSVDGEDNNKEINVKVECRKLNLEGYQRVRVQSFSTRLNPAMTIKNGKITFNTACLRKFQNVEYVELLLNSVERTIAIRPCDESNPNAIKWGKLREGRWCTKTVSCRGLAKSLFDILSWEDNTSYRFRGQYIENEDQKVMLFELDEPEMEKIKEIVLPPIKPEDDESGSDSKDGLEGNTDKIKAEEKRDRIKGEGDLDGKKAEENPDRKKFEDNENKSNKEYGPREEIVIKQKVRCVPTSWQHSFGKKVSINEKLNVLEQRKYAGEWDVLVPAKEIEDMNTFSNQSLNELYMDACKIIEKWDSEQCEAAVSLDESSIK